MRYEFGGYVLDTEQRELIGGDGAIPIRPKVFALLAYLIANRDRVVQKQEVFDRLWAGVQVGDATLNTCIKAARQAIGDSGQRQAAIRTWHGVGYRFVLPVSESSGLPAGSGAPAEHTAPHQDAAALAGAPAGREHKHLSVLDCVVHEAARLAAGLGPEAMYEAMERWMDMAQSIVQGYGGSVTQWSSDGFVALFGAPRAYEDHARRAVTAALDLQRATAAGQGDARPLLPLRIALNTGPVIVGTSAGQLYSAVGETTQTARVLQQAGPPDAVVASAATYGIVADEVAAEPLGHDAVPGAQIIRRLVVRRSGVPNRRQALSRFVGRDQELAILLDRVAQLARGTGQTVGVIGEPGIGKSRLVDELQRSVQVHELRFIRVHCLAYASASPYLPARFLLRQLCETRSSDPVALTLEKLRTVLERAGAASPAALALLGQLLGAPVDEGVLEELSPQERRELTFTVMHHLVATAAQPRPLIVAIEDLQWVDATSEAWLAQLVARLAGMPILLLVTYRPGYEPPWPQRAAATQLALRPLSAEESGRLVRSVPQAAGLSDAALAGVVRRAQGNPFFLEELASALGAGQLDGVGIPDTVHAVLAARIDRLAPADKRLLQTAAVIGDPVPLPLLRLIDDASEQSRERALSRLQEADLIYERPADPGRVLAFKHALTQEVAYRSLLKHTRAPIHRRIAQALQTQFATLARDHPELLAHHLTEAGELQAAVAQWRAAGRRAADRSADLEAIHHFQRALALLPPAAPSSAALRLAVLLDLGVSVQNVNGAGSAEAGQVYAEARALCAGAGSERETFEALFGVWRHHTLRAEFVAARALSDDMLRIARASGDAELALQGYHAVWATARFLGEWQATRECAEQGIALALTGVGSGPFYRFGGHHPVVCARGALAKALLVQGRARCADAELANALTHAGELGHAPTIADAVLAAVDVHSLRRDCERMHAAATRLGDLAAERSLAMFQAIAGFARAWCRTQRGAAERDTAAMRRALQAMQDTGPNAREPYYLALLGEALAACGALTEAGAAFDEACGRIARGGTRHWAAPEVHRLLAEFLASSCARPGDAEAHLLQAVGIACEQGALLLQLRATLSLCQLLRTQGRRGEAATMLSRTLAHAGGDVDAPEYAQAHTLLRELA